MAVSNQTARRLAVLGSTGSIGISTLDVVRHLRGIDAMHIEVAALAAGSKVDLLQAQAREFDVDAVAINDDSKVGELRNGLTGINIFSGEDAALRLVENTDATLVCAAVVGIAGLPSILAAIESGRTVALANKETLVAAGSLVNPMLGRHGASIIPVDSEHSAIFQCLEARQSSQAAVKRVVLTASGGPFRTASKQAMYNATVDQALRHPTWVMGPKVTIDSATMMNKALEIIEAHWLFNLPAQKISVIIHPQSVVHSFVEFEDNAVLAQLGPPDMRTPIQYALTYPDRAACCSQELDWSTLDKLEFESPDLNKFPALCLAYQAIEAGGTAGAILNAANEAAVSAFLEHKICLGRIVELVAEALDSIGSKSVDNLQTILDADHEARSFVNERIAQAI